MRFQALVTTALVLCAQNSIAQGGKSSTQVNNNNQTVTNPWTVRADGGAIILGGFGLNVGRALTNNISAEALYNQTLMKDKDDGIESFEAIHKARTYGARLDYLFNGVDKSGIYVSGSVVHVDLKSEVNPIFTDEIITLNTDKWGGQGKVGYQIISNERAFNLAARLGLGYGLGGSFATTLGGTRNEVDNGLLLDISVGLMF